MADVSSSLPAVIINSENSGGSRKQKTTNTTKTKKNMVPTVKQQPRSKPPHPSTPDMVTAAIKDLKERNGSSFQAIKKYISTNYVLDIEKHAPFIKKYLKNALSTGALIQTKGKGVAGSFRLGSLKADKTKSKSSETINKNQSASPKKSPNAKKITTPKKANSDVETISSSAATVAAAAAATTAATTKAAASSKMASSTSPGKKSQITKAVVVTPVNKKRKPAKGPAAKPPKPKKSWSKSKVTKASPEKQTTNKPTKPKKVMAKKVAPKKK